MIFIVYFTCILLFLDIYAYYLRVKNTPHKFIAFGLFGAMLAVGGVHLIVIQGEPLVIPLAWAAVRYAKKNPAAVSRRLPVILGIVFLATTLLFLNAHNTTESMFLAPGGVHYWLINVLNGFLAGAVLISEKAGMNLPPIVSAVESAAGIPVLISQSFLGIAAFISMPGGYGLYEIFRTRLPGNSLPSIEPDDTLTPSRFMVAVIVMSGIACAAIPTSTLHSLSGAVLLFCALCFSVSGMYFTARLFRRKLSGTFCFLICLVQLFLLLVPALLWVFTIVGITFRVFGLYSFVEEYNTETPDRPAPVPFFRIYLVPAVLALLVLPTKNLTDNFMPSMNQWISTGDIPELTEVKTNAENRTPFVEIAGFKYSFEIDRYEFPNTPGEMPMLVRSADEARSHCEERGLRLCLPDEWEHVCSSGDTQTRIKRNEKKSGGKRWLCNQNSIGLVPIGERIFSDCRPDSYEVNGMAGNAWEIVDTRGDLPITALKGGYFGYGDDYTTQCSYTLIVFDTQIDTLTETHFGFRCCR